MDYFKHHLTAVREEQRKALDGLRALIAEVEAKEAEITGDPDMSDDLKQMHLSRLRREAQKRVPGFAEQAQKAAAKGRDLTRRLRSARSVELANQQRVRTLLDSGWAPVEIAEAAWAAADDDTLAALRAETAYYKPDGHVIEPARLEEINQSLDEAIAGFTMDVQEAQALQASAELRAHEAAVAPTITQALRTTSGQAGPQDRLAAAYASNQADAATPE
jgi:hypothetical protein